eukprot:scaffold92395_cov18-Prasinocladus_malaysianus.AAC.2
MVRRELVHEMVAIRQIALTQWRVKWTSLKRARYQGEWRRLPLILRGMGRVQPGLQMNYEDEDPERRWAASGVKHLPFYENCSQSRLSRERLKNDEFDFVYAQCNDAYIGAVIGSASKHSIAFKSSQKQANGRAKCKGHDAESKFCLSLRNIFAYFDTRKEHNICWSWQFAAITGQCYED